MQIYLNRKLAVKMIVTFNNTVHLFCRLIQYEQVQKGTQVT